MKFEEKIKERFLLITELETIKYRSVNFINYKLIHNNARNI
jgi:hypothetical protein